MTNLLRKPIQGRPILFALLFTLLPLAFLYWIWPTPWQEWTTQEGLHHGKHSVYHRLNRLTGERQFGYPGIFGLTHWLPDSKRSSPK